MLVQVRTDPLPSYQKHNQLDQTPMINNINANNQDQEDGGRRDSLQGSAGLSLGLPQGAFLANLLGPVQSDAPTPSTADHMSNPSLCSNNAPTGLGTPSDQMASMLFNRLDSQNLQASHHLSADLGAYNSAGSSFQNQNTTHTDSLSGLYGQPKQSLTTNMDQLFGMNSNNVAAEFRSFFGPGNVPDLGGGMTSNSSSSPQAFTNNAQPNFSGSADLLVQQHANIHSLSGNLPVQNTLNFNNAISLTAQDTLRNQMNLHNALNNSWQQPLQQQLQQPLQRPIDPPAGGIQQSQQLNDRTWHDAVSLESPPQLPPEIKWKGRGRSSTFPLKLQQMLLDLEKQENGTSIASFLPHGRGFQIHKPKEFAKEIMPNYFRMSTYSSFQRQLNLYDFQRIAEGPEKGAYWHELFLRDQPMLSTGMKRSKVKGSTRARQDERLKNYERQKDLFHR